MLELTRQEPGNQHPSQSGQRLPVAGITKQARVRPRNPPMRCPRQPLLRKQSHLTRWDQFLIAQSFQPCHAFPPSLGRPPQMGREHLRPALEEGVASVRVLAGGATVPLTHCSSPRSLSSIHLSAIRGLPGASWEGQSCFMSPVLESLLTYP